MLDSLVRVSRRVGWVTDLFRHRPCALIRLFSDTIRLAVNVPRQRGVGTYIETGRTVQRAEEGGRVRIPQSSGAATFISHIQNLAYLIKIK